MWVAVATARDSGPPIRSAAALKRTVVILDRPFGVVGSVVSNAADNPWPFQTPNRTNRQIKKQQDLSGEACRQKFQNVRLRNRTATTQDRGRRLGRRFRLPEVL